MEFVESINRFVLGNQILLPRMLCAWLSGNFLGGEDVLLEKALLDQFLQVPSECPAMDGLVLFAVVGRSNTPTWGVRDCVGSASGV